MQNSLGELGFRNAHQGDNSFLSSGIYFAEYGHSGPAPWCALFNLSAAEFKAILLEILENEIEGQEWCTAQFHIATINETPVAAVSAWIEGVNDTSSSLLMSTLMYHFIPEDKRKIAEETLQILSFLRVLRSPGYLQLESIFTLPEYRGKGIITQLIQHILEEQKRKHPELPGVEIQLSSDNKAAIHTYQKCGFEITEMRMAYEESILEIYPGMGKIKMQKLY